MTTVSTGTEDFAPEIWAIDGIAPSFFLSFVPGSLKPMKDTSMDPSAETVCIMMSGMSSLMKWLPWSSLLNQMLNLKLAGSYSMKRFNSSE